MTFTGFRNRTPVAEPVIEPVIPPNPLEGHDVALYVDGKRVGTLAVAAITTDEAMSTIAVTFETTLAAALDPTVDAALALAWGGFMPLDMVSYVAQADDLGSGTLQIESLIPPAQAGGQVIFVCRAYTQVWRFDTGTLLAEPGDVIEIAYENLQKQ